MQQLSSLADQAVRPWESGSYQNYKYTKHISLRFRTGTLRRLWSRWWMLSTTHCAGLGKQTAMEGELQKQCWAAGRGSVVTAYLRDLPRCHLWRSEESSDHLIPDNARDKLAPLELFLFDQRFHEVRNQVATTEQGVRTTTTQMGFNPSWTEAIYHFLIYYILVHSIHTSQQVQGALIVLMMLCC